MAWNRNVHNHCDRDVPVDAIGQKDVSLIIQLEVSNLIVTSDLTLMYATANQGISTAPVAANVSSQGYSVANATKQWIICHHT